jgi:hypothetical protein
MKSSRLGGKVSAVCIEEILAKESNKTFEKRNITQIIVSSRYTFSS